jgi:hypothetical protein
VKQIFQTKVGLLIQIEIEDYLVNVVGGYVFVSGITEMSFYFLCESILLLSVIFFRFDYKALVKLLIIELLLRGTMEARSFS